MLHTSFVTADPVNLDTTDPYAFRPLTTSRIIARAGGAIALLDLIVALVILVIYAVDDHQDPGVVEVSDLNFVIALTAAAAVAFAASVAAYLLDRRSMLSRTVLAVFGLVVAFVVTGALTLLFV
jgi:hypothetical protein